MMWLLLRGGGTQVSRLLPQRLAIVCQSCPPLAPALAAPLLGPAPWPCPLLAQLHSLLHHHFREPFPDRHLKRLSPLLSSSAYLLQSSPYFAWSISVGCLSGQNASTARWLGVEEKGEGEEEGEGLPL